jgi:hypothetical protein
MKYKDYAEYSKTYVLVHNTGFGVQEDNYIEHEVVYETDDYDDAINTSLELKMKNNTDEQIKSGWCDNTYQININTLTKNGKLLYDKFIIQFLIYSKNK